MRSMKIKNEQKSARKRELERGIFQAKETACAKVSRAESRTPLKKLRREHTQEGGGKECWEGKRLDHQQRLKLWTDATQEGLSEQTFFL